MQSSIALIAYNEGMGAPIKTYSLTELENLVVELGQPRFRAQQLSQWIYAKSAAKYSDMTNIPSSLRDKLEREHPLHTAEIIDKRISVDGTRKYVLKLSDGELVETVGMPSVTSEGKERLTVCFSSQVGCGIGCVFCATGHEGFKRNLTVGEIVDQVSIVQNDFGKRVTNAVGMGQGEPFLNYQNLMNALRILKHPKFHNIGARHITVSTCGIISGIKKLSNEKEQFTLAVSLHAAKQGTRDFLMPHMKNQPLGTLKNELSLYQSKTNRRVSLEYLMIEGINDDEKHLKALTDFCEGMLCHVNLLPMNRVSSSPFSPSTKETINHWMDKLEARGIETTVRNSRGSDIAGACGQLKNALMESC